MTAPHIARARSTVVERVLTDTVKVERITGLSTDAAPPHAVTETRTTLYSGAGLFDTGTGGRPRPVFTLADDLQVTADMRVKLPYGTAAEPGDRITCTGSENSAITGVEVEVLGPAEGTRSVTKIVWCRRMTDNPLR